jgi:hypothetical protein
MSSLPLDNISDLSESACQEAHFAERARRLQMTPPTNVDIATAHRLTSILHHTNSE